MYFSSMAATRDYTPPYIKVLPYDYYLCGSLNESIYKKSTHRMITDVQFQQYLDKNF